MSGKALVLFAQQVPSAPYHTRYLAAQFRFELLVYHLQIQVLHRLSLRTAHITRHRINQRVTQVHLVGIVADSPSAKTLFLEYQSFVQESSVILVTGSHIQILHLLVAFVYQMLEKQIYGTILPTLVTRGNILDMCHLSAFEYHSTCNNMVLTPYHIQLYVLGKKAHQQQNLLVGMYRFAMMMRHQHVLQQNPELLQTCFVGFRDTIQVTSVIHSLLGLTHTKGAHLQGVTLIDGSTNQSSGQLCSRAKQGIQILIAGKSTINIRYRLVVNLNSLHVIAIIAQHLLHDGQHLHLGHLGQDNQSSVGKSLMRINTFRALIIVGREHSHKVPRSHTTLLVLVIRRNTVVYQQRTVKEPIAMIIHKVALQQESSVLGTLHKRIPRFFPIYRIRYYRHFVVNSRNSS